MAQGTIRRVVAATTLAMVATVAVGSSTVAPAAAETGGRFRIEDPGRFDSRLGPPIAAGTKVVVGGSYDQLIVIGRAVAGTVRLASCSTGVVTSQLELPANGNALFTMIGDGNLCYSADVATDYVLDRLGSVSATPAPGRSQFIPTAPLVVATLSAPPATESIPFALPAVATPPGSTHAMFRIDVDADDTTETRAGAVTLISCSAPPPPVVNVAYGEAASHGISFVALAGGPMCARVLNGRSRFTITLVGWLSNEGPDASRIPPMLHTLVAPVPPARLRPLTPTRVLDTREGLGAPAALVGGAPGIVLQDLPLTADSTAVVLNMTVTESTGGGFVTVWPCDVARPTASNLNFTPGETVANQVVVSLGASRTVCVYSLVPTHLVADVTGTYESGNGLGQEALTPARILDTRDGLGAPATRVPGGGFIALQVAGRGGAPAGGVGAVTMNATVTDPTAGGFVTVWPCDQPRPTASSINYVSGQTIPNLVTSKLAADGTVCLFASTPTHLIADIATVFVPDAPTGFSDVEPSRILDTRSSIGRPGVAKFAPNQPFELQVAGRGGVPPTGATAVTMNVTATEPDGGGYVTAWPCDRPRPTASNLNLTPGVTRPNLVSVQLSATGTVCLVTTSSTHLIADVAGYATALPELVATTTLS